MAERKKINLIIIPDGVGYPSRDAIDAKRSAIGPENAPNLFRFLEQCAGNRGLLHASGAPMGLKPGQMGSSEVGHATISAGGSGLDDNLPAATLGAGAMARAFQEEVMKRHHIVQEDIKHVLENDKTVHLIGILSDGDIHSNIDDIISTIRIYGDAGCKVCLHALTDGRDTAEDSAPEYFAKLEAVLQQYQDQVILGTVCGRDILNREGNFVPTVDYGTLVANGKRTSYKQINSIQEWLQENYLYNVYDNKMAPTVHSDYNGLFEGDVVICCHHRPDRIHQVACLFAKDFTGCDTQPDDISMIPDGLRVRSFIPLPNPTIAYYVDIDYPQVTLASVHADLGAKQYRIAHAEKRNHVERFFNGGSSVKIPNCEVITFSSEQPYKEFPEMEASAVAEATINAMQTIKDTEGVQDGLVVLNFANPDMVGHMGEFDPAYAAVQAMDTAFGDVLLAANVFAKDMDITVTVVPDHGNVDEMIDENDKILTKHSCARVPYGFMSFSEQQFDPKGPLRYIEEKEFLRGDTLTLGSVAPTLLQYLANQDSRFSVPPTMNAALDIKSIRQQLPEMQYSMVG